MTVDLTTQPSEILDNNEFKPIERKSLAERVADELRNLVLLEKLKPGAAIPERETAEGLGISRTPLRESLRILASEGLVVIEPNRPPRVANPSLAEIKDLLQVQGALEALAGALACENADETEIQQIKSMETQMQQASGVNHPEDPLAFFQLDMNFHEAIVAASGNADLKNTHKMYNGRLWRARFISSRLQVNRVGTLAQHANIVAALITRDADACSDALRKHLDTGYQNIKSVFAMHSQEQQGESQ